MARRGAGYLLPGAVTVEAHVPMLARHTSHLQVVLQQADLKVALVMLAPSTKGG